MTKKIKLWLFLLIIIVVFVGIYFINNINQSNHAQKGYDLYQQGESQAAFELFSQTADSDPQSAYALAMMYMDGIGTQSDDTKAENWLIKSAKANNKNALYNLGYYRYNQYMEDVPDDLYGIVSITKAADLGVKEAQELIGSIYINDKYDNTPQNIELARKYFSLAAEQNSPLAKFALGYIAYNFDKDNKRAVEILTPLVSKNFPLPAMLLATIYEEGGNGITPNKLFAEKYQEMSYSSALGLVDDSQELEPTPLSLYGVQTAEEKQALLANLELLASQDNETAIYMLAQKYLTGDGVPKSKARAMAYLQPLVMKKNPKALYLSYSINPTQIKNLIAAADANYPDAVYMLYRLYSGDTFNNNVERNKELAEKYLTAAADLSHLDALETLISQALNNYSFPNKKLNAIVEKYTPILLEKYPNSPRSLLLASQAYGENGSSIYSPEKSFELMEKATQLAPTSDNKIRLAIKYAYGLGTQQDLTKAVPIFKTILDEDSDNLTANRQLITLYYQYDIKNLIDDAYIIKLLENDVVTRENYDNAHHYADYLMQQDPVKNLDKAFDLYQTASKYSYGARIHYAKALLRYKQDQEKLASEITLELINSEKSKAELSEPQLKDAYTIILKTGMVSPESKAALVHLALSENNPDALKQIEPLIGVDAEITYQYGINKLAQVKNIDTAPDTEIKPYYDAILKAADLGSISASLYIIQNLDAVNYVNDKPYYKSRFQKITGLTINDLIPRYKKCAELGSNRCLYDLGEIYQKGNYGEDADYDIALSYYHKISKADFSFLKWRLEEIEKGKKQFIEIQAKAHKGDSDALRTLAQAYEFGNYGQKIDKNKWLEYLSASAKLNNESALEELIDYYSQDNLLDDNKAKIIGYYNQLANIGSQDYTRKLAHQYLNGSRLVEANRQKAREYYVKSGSWGDQYIEYMDDFDIGMEMINNSPSAKYKVGRAYLRGYGVKEDISQAIKYLKQASEEGNSSAISLYEEMLYNGVYDKENKTWIIEPDWNEAIIWLRKNPNKNRTDSYINVYNTIALPALNGDTKAYLELAEWYKSRGQYPAARIWYNKSVAAGNLDAIRLIDSMIEDNEEKYSLYQMGIEKGDTYSQVKLAKLDIYDANIPTDSERYNLALQRLNDALKSNNSFVSEEAFETLSHLYRVGISGKDELEANIIIRDKDSAKYLALLESESANRTNALKDLYTYYAPTDSPKALGYLQQAYQKGDLEAIEILYKLNYPGEYCNNSHADIDQAGIYLNEWLVKGNFSKTQDRVYVGYPESRTKAIGEVYLDGDCDIDRNIDKAIEWFKISLKYHDTHALDALYKAYTQKWDAKESYYYALLLEKDPDDIELLDRLSETDKQAVDERFAQEQEFQKYGRYAEEIEAQRLKAEAGDRIAAFSLGISYARGEKVPEDTQKMIYYYEIAGKNGYSRAYNILGNLYRKDNERGIERDYPKALYYFDLGAQQNDSNTAHLAGDMLYFGQGVEKDFPRAAKYFEMTDLEQGNHHAMAKYKLGYMYYNGLIGTKSPQDIQKAYDYLQIAAKYQNENAIKALKEWDFSQIKSK